MPTIGNAKRLTVSYGAAELLAKEEGDGHADLRGAHRADDVLHVDWRRVRPALDLRSQIHE